MDDKEFQTHADEALKDLYDRLGGATEHHPLEADFNAGALTVEFEDSSTKFVVSPNAPVKQIWVSAHMKSYKLDWDAGRSAFVVNGKTLVELIGDAVGTQLGTKIEL